MIMRLWKVFYNRKRRHSTIKYCTPEDFEQGEFQKNISPLFIESARAKGIEDTGRIVSASFNTIRDMYEKNEEIYNTHVKFQELLKKQNREGFLSRYMVVMSMVTKYHVEEVANNMEKYVNISDREANHVKKVMIDRRGNLSKEQSFSKCS